LNIKKYRANSIKKGIERWEEGDLIRSSNKRTRASTPNLVVLSFSELDSRIPINSLGEIKSAIAGEVTA
jgi:hypothetical protein